MSVPDTPPPRYPGFSFVTVLLVLGGLLMLAPGVCAISFIREYMAPGYHQTPISFVVLWIISFTISAAGIALIVYAFRRFQT